MTSSNGNIFRVTGPSCGEFSGPGEFPAQRPMTGSFDVFFDLRLNKRLSKQPWGWWFETPSWSLCVTVMELAQKTIPRRAFELRDKLMKLHLNFPTFVESSPFWQNKKVSCIPGFRLCPYMKRWGYIFHALLFFHFHYNDVIMGAVASQITSLAIVCSTVYSDADQRKHQSSASLAFVLGIHRWPVNSPHKWPVTRKMFPFDDVIMFS